jgi:putative phosphoesterase
MKIAIFSDVHDNVWTLKAALHWLRSQEHDRAVSALIYCGDLCSPFTARLIVEACKDKAVPIHLVWGNNDADTARITALTRDFTFLQIHNELAELMVVGDDLLTRKEYEASHGEYWASPAGCKRIAVNHYDNIAFPIAASGKYHVVLFGHNHTCEARYFGSTLALNPGALMSYNPLKKGDDKDIPATFAVYDSQTSEEKPYQFYEVTTRWCSKEEPGEVRVVDLA